jgi:transcriptional regulator with XRE-family HTH domain
MSALIQNWNPKQNVPSLLRQRLTEEFRDEEYRYAYAASFLNTKLASQIKTLRQQREMTQAQVAEVMGIKQPGYARFEDVNHSVWKTDTLWDIARALDVRVNISFETFGSLIDEKEHFDKEHLERPKFTDDPLFKEPGGVVDSANRASLASINSYRDRGVFWKGLVETIDIGLYRDTKKGPGIEISTQDFYNAERK